MRCTRLSSQFDDSSQSFAPRFCTSTMHHNPAPQTCTTTLQHDLACTTGRNISVIAETPEPLHYAVIFTSTTSDNTEGYVDMAAKMVELARLQPGSPGIESARSEVAITVSYWSDRESIKAWKLHAEHPAAQKNGRTKNRRTKKWPHKKMVARCGTRHTARALHWWSEPTALGD